MTSGSSDQLPPEEPDADSWQQRLRSLGGIIRAQRQIAGLSLRQLADITDVSNAYLSQIERGKHEPSVRILNNIAVALNISSEALLGESGLLAESSEAATDTSMAIRTDPQLTDEQKQSLLSVYQAYLAANASPDA